MAFRARKVFGTFEKLFPGSSLVPTADSRETACLGLLSFSLALKDNPSAVRGLLLGMLDLLKECTHLQRHRVWPSHSAPRFRAPSTRKSRAMGEVDAWSIHTNWWCPSTLRQNTLLLRYRNLKLMRTLIPNTLN